MSKRKLEVTTESGDTLEIMPLGAGSEVGRSCILLTFKGKKIMLDCGIHPAYPGVAGLPYFDQIDDASEIDLLLVSHFHLDHCAALPYFLEKTKFKGRVFMTHPTKAIYKMILSDFVKVSHIAIEELLYDESDLNNSMDKIEPINYHQEIVVDGIRFWSYNAGHVLGAAMFMIEIAGVHILYTGDYSRQEDRHLMAAELPKVKPDVLIVESTYGVQNHEPREAREARFTGIAHSIVERGGRCLIPVFALGRAQELLLILDEYWEANKSLHDIPIYYASSLAKKCMNVYQTYINMMNERIRKQYNISNPFEFKHISNLKSIENFEDTGPSVVMASPGMLQNGPSRELFEKWCSSPKNGVIIPGYCVEGTLAKHIITEPPTIQTMSGQTLPMKMSVDYISFSAHSDFQQTCEFIDLLEPPNIILVHGEQNEMSRLKTKLVERHAGRRNVAILTPKNCETVKLVFSGEKTAKIVGSLATKELDEGIFVSGILIQKDFNHRIIAPGDLSAHTRLTTTAILQNQKIPFVQSFDLLEKCVKQMFDSVERIVHNDLQCLLVHEAVYVLLTNTKYINVEWSSNPVNDMIADSVLSVILQIEVNPATNSLIGAQSCCSGKKEKLHTAKCFLATQFESVQVDDAAEVIHVSDGQSNATIHYSSLLIDCEDPQLKDRLSLLFNNIKAVVDPI